MHALLCIDHNCICLGGQVAAIAWKWGTDHMSEMSLQVTVLCLPEIFPANTNSSMVCGCTP